MIKVAKTCLIAAAIGCATFSALAKTTAAKPQPKQKTTAAEKSKADVKIASIEQRMKAMRLPEVSFKPPQTISDAVKFFEEASRKYDSPEIPEEKRGFSILNVSALANILFADKSESGIADATVIPMLRAKDISFYDALNLVCESIGYKSYVSDLWLKYDEKTKETIIDEKGIVIVMPKESYESFVKDMRGMEIEMRMKAMRLPEVSFKPPKTIADAVEFFREASKKYDSPEIPKEMRGFNFLLRAGMGADMPEIPAFKAKDISFYDAMKRVCDSIGYMFVVSDSIVVIESKEAHAQEKKEKDDAEKAAKEGAKKLMPKRDAKSAEIMQRMKEMRLPKISFKGQSIADAVEFFRTASMKYDSRKIPKGERGFNIVLQLKDGEAPEISMIKARDISLYDGMKIVCEMVDYEFSVCGGIVVVKPRDGKPFDNGGVAAQKAVQAHSKDFGTTPHLRFRFSVDAPRSDGDSMQLSEIELLDAKGAAIPRSAYAIAYDSSTMPKNGDEPFPDDERPENAVDGDRSTKWLDWRAGLNETDKVRAAAWLEFRFNKATTVYGYRWYTANDEPGRTPVSWTLSASDDEGATWRVLDKVENHETTSKRNSLAYKFFR